MSWSLYIGTENPVSSHTYNLSAMWRRAGMFENASSELDGLTGAVIAERADQALVKALREREAFEALNPANGWGDYEGFVRTLADLALAAHANPDDTADWFG